MGARNQRRTSIEKKGLPNHRCENGMAPGSTVPPLLAPALLPLGPQPEQSFDLDRPLREARDAFEKSYFEFHLAKEGGSMTRVAEKTGLERTHLYRKLKQLGVVNKVNLVHESGRELRYTFGLR